MVDVSIISIEEFKEKIYNDYEKLFPEEEQRDWEIIEENYNKGIEQFYKIALDNKIIGFLMLEKIKEEYPYYLDYFAIYKEYQNKGYGFKSIDTLINKVIKENDLIGEIEKENENELNTIRRMKFYDRLGFKKINSEYLLFNVLYTPIIKTNKKEVNKEKLDKIFFEYYKINSGNYNFEENCKLLK